MPAKHYRPNKQGYAAYRAKQQLLSSRMYRVTPREFYDDIFPDADLERPGHPEDGRANMIIVYRTTTPAGKTRMLNQIIFSGKKGLEVAMGNEFAVCGMCLYSGKRRTAANAYLCYGFAIDLDGVGPEECTTFLNGVEADKLPRPQYVVNSGHGLHLYYVFETPVPLYPVVRERLQRLKYALTRILWTNETSYIRSRPDDDRRDYQGVYQNFRMPGSCSKIGRGVARSKYLVTAYRYTTYPGVRCNLHTLSEWVNPKDRIPKSEDYSAWDYDCEHMTLDQARREYPDWYEKRIVQGLPAGQWVCAKALYTWWLNLLQQDDGARDGTRYNCIAVLFIYAIKCAVSYDEVLADAMGLVDLLDARTVKPDNRFTAKDVLAASQYYKRNYARYSVKMIEMKTHIKLPRNKRNGRKQVDHCKLMRLIRDEINGHADTWRNKNGRPKNSGIKLQQVQAWRAAHPTGRKIDCQRDTGLSRPTVLKWWDAAAPTDCQ